MPEGLVKIGSDLYSTILPMVKAQVESQIKVRDLSAAKLSISPANHSSWAEARTDLVSENKTRLRAELEAELSGCSDVNEIENTRNLFHAKERGVGPWSTIRFLHFHARLTSTTTSCRSKSLEVAYVV